jgi:hypothetical protein
MLRSPNAPVGPSRRTKLASARRATRPTGRRQPTTSPTKTPTSWCPSPLTRTSFPCRSRFLFYLGILDVKESGTPENALLARRPRSRASTWPAAAMGQSLGPSPPKAAGARGPSLARSPSVRALLGRLSTLAFSTVNGLCLALLYGRAVCITAKNCGPGSDAVVQVDVPG